MVLDLVKKLRDRGIALLIISHNLNDVFAVADRLAVLHLGRMAAQGPLSDFDTQSAVELITTGSLSGTRATVGRGRAAEGRGDG
jgi:ABC-type sugar transport system ATPase subunit